MMYEDQYFITSCIVAENRKLRPVIKKSAQVCPFCPGNESYIEHIRYETKTDESEFSVRIVNNKYPVCSSEGDVYGVHDVVIDTPQHLTHPKDFSNRHWKILLETMQERWHQIARDPNIAFIQVFKNYGKSAGASIVHSHWQIIALSQIPYPMQLQYKHHNTFKTKGQSCCLCHQLEQLKHDTLILENENWAAIAPEVSEFPHETWLIPKLHRKHFGDLESNELETCGELLKKLLTAYDKLKEGCAFNICLIGGGIQNTLDYHFYIKIIPRLSHLAGFELATGCTINTIHPKTHVQLMKSIL